MEIFVYALIDPTSSKKEFTLGTNKLEHKPFYVGHKIGKAFPKRINPAYFKSFRNMSEGQKDIIKKLVDDGDIVSVVVLKNASTQDEALTLVEKYGAAIGAKDVIEAPKAEAEKSTGVLKGIAAYNKADKSLAHSFTTITKAKEWSGLKLVLKNLSLDKPVEMGDYLWIKVDGELKESL